MQEPVEEKKGRGWWAQRLIEVDKRSEAAEKTLYELKAVLIKDKKLQELLNHPAIMDFEMHDKRMRQIEQLLTNLSREVNGFRGELKVVKAGLASVEQRRTRGA